MKAIDIGNVAMGVLAGCALFLGLALAVLS
jgi:hypothetical protein